MVFARVSTGGVASFGGAAASQEARVKGLVKLKLDTYSKRSFLTGMGFSFANEVLFFMGFANRSTLRKGLYMRVKKPKP